VDAREQTNKQEQLGAAQRLWRFATEVYAKPGVAKACLAAQDAWAADVNLMLYLSWCALEGRPLQTKDIRLAQERCRPWREQVILPLRQQRLAWGELDGRRAEYAAIKKMELEAERVQLEFLAALSEEGSVPTRITSQTPATQALLVQKHLELLAAHYGLESAAFEPFFNSLTEV